HNRNGSKHGRPKEIHESGYGGGHLSPPTTPCRSRAAFVAAGPMLGQSGGPVAGRQLDSLRPSGYRPDRRRPHSGSIGIHARSQRIGPPAGSLARHSEPWTPTVEEVTRGP